MDECFSQHVELKINQWAKSQTAIRAVVEIGSQSRKDHPADKWSDLDLFLLFTKPIQPSEKRGWIKEISCAVGDVWSIAQEPGSNPDWFSLGNFISGRFKVDLVGSVIPDAVIQLRDLEDILPKIPFAYVFHPSCKVIYDLLGIPREISITSGRYIPQFPDEAELLDCFRHFWMELVHAAQLFNRGEQWHAINLQSNCQEKLLLKLIEWHSFMFQDPEKIWPRGRFLEEWADSRIVSDLQGLQLGFNRDTFWDSIFKLFDLHQRIALEICSQKGLSFPYDEANAYRRWLKDFSSCHDHIRQV